MKKILSLFTFILFLNSCEKKITYNAADTNDYRKNFDNGFINQFPKKIECNYYNIIANTNDERNDVGLLLYVYGIEKAKIVEIKNKTRKSAIAKYFSKDKCLLVINRFETFETHDSLKSPVIDSLKIDNDCEKKLYPIPSFIDFRKQNKSNDLKLDDSFEIYVLECKYGNSFKKYQLLPNPQMPQKWKNGNSKGIAISEKEGIIIYWSIIW